VIVRESSCCACSWTSALDVYYTHKRILQVDDETQSTRFMYHISQQLTHCQTDVQRWRIVDRL